ncbi:MAG: hypothetical protein GVY19_10755 [Bacteroidetes bacterium]|jgi:hypothetical protein|nr:hypothetical protein [Bacteroidota bacterium]
MNFKIRCIITLLLISLGVHGQEKSEEPTVKAGGFVRYDMIMDTYESVDSRDGMLYFYPLPEVIDEEGNDINENLQFEMLSLTSRVNLEITGPEILGAQTSSFIEGDFFGTTAVHARLFRLRHAYIKFVWPSELEVLMGHYWHPMFVTECFANPLTFAVALPFHGLNRSSQVRFTYPITPSVTVVSAFLMHGAHKSKGPSEAQRNSGLPDSQLQMKFKQGSYFLAVTGGYKFLQPRLMTENELKTNKMANSFNVGASFKAVYNPLTIKLGSVFGENLTHFRQIGGFGAKQDPESTDDYDYANMQTYSIWADMHTNGTFRLGLMAGYTENLGSAETYFSLGNDYERGEDLKSVYSVSPRISYHKNNFSAGLEYKLTAAAWGTNFDENHRATKTNETMNNRIVFTTTYSF